MAADQQCLNCGQIIEGNFCANCGQKKFKRIDRKYIWDELQYTVIHTNKGFLYSLKKVIINPGATAREFIEGDRVKHYKPILLVFVLSGISAFLSFKVLHLKEVMTAYFTQQHMNSGFMTDMMSFISSYNSILMLLLVPLFAFTTKLAFRKWGHNYYEHVVMNAYILSFYILTNIVFVYPFMFVYRNDPSAFFTASQYTMLLVPFILCWFFRGFYPDKPFTAILLRVFGALALTVMGYLLVLVIAVIIGVIVASSNGTATIKYVKPG